MNRVLVTGAGIISGCGVTLDAYWRSLIAGANCFSIFNETTNATPVGPVTDTSHAAGLPLHSLSALDRSGVFAVAAALRALEDAGLPTPVARPERVAVIFGNGGGGLETLEEQYRRLHFDNKRAHPATVLRVMVSASASWVSIVTGAQGPCFVTSSACASASHAIAVAASLVKSGMADVAIAGGTEAPLTKGNIMAWESMKVMSRSLCRPFAKGRDGLIIAEGAGALILESEEHARTRGCDSRIELAGFGSNADARDMVAPKIEGMAGSMRGALESAGLAASEIDYVNAHGTATRANDIAETAAMKQVFGDRCPPVSSTKSVHGHTLGAAGALEAVATVLAMQHGVAPPTANYDAPDPECDLDYVPNESRELNIRAALSNSFAFGGLNSTLAFRML